MSVHKKSASENDLKQFVEATLQEYGLGITKLMTLKTLHQVGTYYLLISNTSRRCEII